MTKEKEKVTSLNIIRNLTCKEKYPSIQMCNGYLCMSVCYIYMCVCVCVYIYMQTHIQEFFRG